jgi:ParB family chromosome partitioning protein
MSEFKKQVLGRGLSALFDPSQPENSNSVFPASLAIGSIIPGINQPRRYFPEEELESLASSIREKGILQPILVRSIPSYGEDAFEIVAGERRWRAAKLAGLSHIPALIKEFTNAEALEVGLLENIQRQDLNPIEEAEGYRRLTEEFNHTQESLAQILGKSRSHIANTLRLLSLSKKIKGYLNEGKLSAGHGRALINADDPEGLADLIVQKNLSVRQAENLSKQKLTSGKSLSSYSQKDPEKEILISHLSSLLGTTVDLNVKGMGGKIIISFKDPAELDLIIQKLNQLVT